MEFSWPMVPQKLPLRRTVRVRNKIFNIGLSHLLCWRELGRAQSRVRVKSLSGEEMSGVEDDACLCLREKLAPELEKDGVDAEKIMKISEACADACSNFLATGRAFDTMMIMDAMEEEIERRDLRGDDFLPFELGRKAAKVLTQRWNDLPVTERPKSYRQQAYVNKKDVVDFDKWPKNATFP